jgi:hypothetical protein
MTCKRLISPELLSESLIILSFFDGFQLLEPTTKEQLEALQNIIDGESTNTSLRIEAITFEITVQTVISTLAIIINLPLISLVDEERLPLPMFSLSPKNNALSRQNQILLSNYLGNLKDDDILNSISCIESFANGLVVAPVANTDEDGGISDEVEVEDEVRVWFWLQSLSTKSKRDDIVNWAPEYHLTGFVLAGEYLVSLTSSFLLTFTPITGKPGILCLEGKSSSINNYMSEIKSVSWSGMCTIFIC